MATNEMMALLEAIKQTTLSLVPLICVIAASIGAGRAFYKQKEYELLRKRYLEDGVDLVAEDVEHALIVFNANWRIALTILKFYRDMGAAIDQNLLDASNFAPFDVTKFRGMPSFKLQRLTGSFSFWGFEQLLFARLGNANEFFMHDLLESIKVLIKKDIERENRKKVAEDFLEKSLEHKNKIYKAYGFLASLSELSSVLERCSFSRRGLDRIKYNKTVKKIVADLEAVLKEEDSASSLSSAPPASR